MSRPHRHRQHRRLHERRHWSEDTRVTIGVGITVALIFGALFGTAYLFPPKDGTRPELAKSSVLVPAPASPLKLETRKVK
jgi:hypothetical protein